MHPSGIYSLPVDSHGAFQIPTSPTRYLIASYEVVQVFDAKSTHSGIGLLERLTLLNTGTFLTPPDLMFR